MKIKRSLITLMIMVLALGCLPMEAYAQGNNMGFDRDNAIRLDYIGTSFFTNTENLDENGSIIPYYWFEFVAGVSDYYTINFEPGSDEGSTNPDDYITDVKIFDSEGVKLPATCTPGKTTELTPTSALEKNKVYYVQAYFNSNGQAIYMTVPGERHLRPTKSWEITYNLNGGTGTAPVDSEWYFGLDTPSNLNLYSPDNDPTVPAQGDMVAPQGATFTGWRDGTGKEYAVGDKIASSDNVTLYAQWKIPSSMSDADSTVYTIDDESHTVAGGSSSITTQTTVQQVLTSMTFSPHATYKIVDSGQNTSLVNNAMSALAKAGTEKIMSGDQLVVIADNGINYSVYTLVPLTTIEKPITIGTAEPLKDAAIANGINTPPAGASTTVVTWSADGGSSYTAASGNFSAGTAYKTKYDYTASEGFVFDSTIAENDITVTNLGGVTKNVALTGSNKTLTITITWPATSIQTPGDTGTPNGTGITGTGSSADPYIISNADQLAYVAQQVNHWTNASSCYKLANDIDLSCYTSWTPIGNSSTPFSGTFDGDNHKVRGININAPGSDFQGLFGAVNSGTVKNIGVVDSYIRGRDCVGGVVGLNNNNNNTSSIVQNCYNTGSVTGNSSVGGVVGKNYNASTVQNCYNTGSVTGSSNDVGGVVGCNSLNSATVENCYNTGSVTGTGNLNYNANVGGVVGCSFGATEQNCYNLGSVTGNSCVGGVVGSASSSRVNYCYNTGNVTGNFSVGGVVGSILSYSEMNSSYNAGSVSGNYSVGGLYCESYASAVGYNCYYDRQMRTYAASSFTAGGNKWLTSEIVGTSMDRDSHIWASDPELYPRLVGMDTTDAAYVSASPLTLASTNSTTYETAASISSNFTVSTANGVSWTSSTPSVISISGAVATVTRQSSDTNVTLTATKNNVSRTVKVTVKAYDSIISKALTINTTAPIKGATIANGTNTPPIGASTPAVTWSADGGSSYTAASGNFAAGKAYKTQYVYTASTGYVFDNTIAANDISVTGGTVDSATVSTAAKGNDTLTIIVTWSTTAAAAPANWSDGINSTTDTWDNGGIITTATDLAQFAYNVNHGKNYANKTITLANDIDLSDKEWTPIGMEGFAFKGTFDGAGKIITGIKIGTPDAHNSTVNYVGLFGYVIEGTIKNLGVEVAIYSNVKETSDVGGLVGVNKSSTITNSYATGNVSGGSRAYVGGLVGYTLLYSTITNSYATGNVVGGSEASVGGLVGYTLLYSTITNSYATGNVVGGSVAPVGGLVGTNESSTITNSYATGNVVGGSEALVGGLTGGSGGIIKNSYATGNVAGGSEALVGGLTGFNFNVGEDADAGGLNLGIITNCYWNDSAMQTVGGTEQTKKGIGVDKDGTVTNVIGMTSSDMQAVGFVNTLNTNVDTLADKTLYKWKAVSNDYPTFSDTLWSAPETYTMSGTIKDMNNNFVSGATVTLTPNAGTPNPATTGTDGKYTINNVPDGSYRITVTLPNGGGSFTKDVTVPGGNFDIKQPTTQTYTVAYHANGGTGSMIAQTTNVGTDTTVSANGFTKTGYTFASWNTAANGSGTTYTVNGTVPSQTAETTVTLYAQWTETTYSVSGIVTDSADKNASGVSVKLMKGKTPIGLQGVTTTADGKFTITGVLNGTYNLVLEKDGMVVTKKIVVNSADYTLSDIIKMPNGKINSVVKVEANTPDIVVGNLDAQFDSSDITHAQTANNAVEIKLVAEKKAVNDVQADVNKIAAVASNKTVGLYLNLSVTKTITTNSVVNSTTQMSTLPSIIEIIIPMPEELQGKDGLAVYRVHNGTAAALPKGLGNAVDGEYFVVSGNFVTLYTKNFSTYAIGYTTPSNNNTGGGSGGGLSSSAVAPTVTAEPSEGGKITISNDKKIAKIIPDEGYVIADVIVDGKSIGATENYTFADSKTHKITALFVKEVALPYYIQNGRTVYLGFSAVVEKIYKYTAPNGVKVEFKENPKNFTDNTIAWAKPSIDFVAEREIFFGTTQDKFGPNESMSRGMFVTVIGRLYERSYGNISGTSTFSDVATNDYFAKYVAWATENGIIKGIGENKFAPNDKVTREQMAVIMLNFATFLKKADVKDSSLAYADSISISSWAIEGAKYCQQTKVITGRDGGCFAPQESATRAEVAAVIERFVKTIVK